MAGMRPHWIPRDFSAGHPQYRRVIEWGLRDSWGAMRLMDLFLKPDGNLALRLRPRTIHVSELVEFVPAVHGPTAFLPSADLNFPNPSLGYVELLVSADQARGQKRKREDDTSGSHSGKGRNDARPSATDRRKKLRPFISHSRHGR